ncbi:MAG: alpha/beta fold hydrolase [Vicinamibacterales bacterium]|nr:alpha/beta fold hydrolase [Vicinamibacterales bacterium]
MSAACRLFLLVLTCGAALPAAAAAQSLSFPALAGDARAGEGVTAPCAAPGLVGRAQCGVFRVLEDRDAEAMGSRTIDIAFIVLEALEPSGRVDDPLIHLPGGPGEAFTPAAVPLSAAFPDLRRHRDVLLVDVRGVGRSGALSCDVPYPGGLPSRFGAVFPVEHVSACRDALAQRARLDRYTTVSTVDDLEELRRWLGYSAYNLIGGSYGTRVAQIYMRRYPDAVRTAVMNGVAPVAGRAYVTHARLLQRALDRLLEECRASAGCGAAYPGLDASLARLIARFADGPQQVVVNGVPVRFGIGDLGYALRGLLYGRGAELPGMIAAAASGPLEPLAEYYLERTNWVGGANGYAGYHFSVLCAEDIAATTDEEVAREGAGTFMGGHLIDGYRAACRAWPHASLPASHFTPVVSDVPTLLLSGSRDPVTPPEGADAVAAHLTHHVHVVVPNGGHGVGGPCIGRMITRLVATGGLDGIDTSCVGAAPPTPFRLPQ